MQLLDWPFLDALQTGALLALSLGFGLDALSRRDRMLGLLALACLLLGLRHGVLAIGTLPTLNPDLVDRLQGLLVATGFISLCAAFTLIFPRHIPRRFPAWAALGLVPSYLRSLVLSHPSLAEVWLHHAYNLAYLVSCGFIIHWTMRARQDRDPMGRRLFPSLLVVALPVVIELLASSLFNMKIRLSGLSMMILAMAIGASWQRVVVNGMEIRIRRAEAETEGWRNLVPGNAFRTDLPSPMMEQLFGGQWAERIKATPEALLIGGDGVPYRIRSRPFHHQERLGWCQREETTQPGRQGFLSGWTVGLGMDNALEHARIRALLLSWGAQVEDWGTVPPREGPYPSVLLWAREPSILSVWREDDLLRRRPRWIQIGGPVTKGPHARLEPGASQEQLWQILDELLSRR